MSYRLTPPPHGAPHESGVFQDWYTKIYLSIKEISDGVSGPFSEALTANRSSAYPSFGIRAGTNMSVTQDAMGFTISASGYAPESDQNILANRIFGA